MRLFLIHISFNSKFSPGVRLVSIKTKSKNIRCPFDSLAPRGRNCCQINREKTMFDAASRKGDGLSLLLQNYTFNEIFLLWSQGVV